MNVSQLYLCVDNNRTPVVFQVSDNLVFVGDMSDFRNSNGATISCIRIYWYMEMVHAMVNWRLIHHTVSAIHKLLLLQNPSLLPVSAHLQHEVPRKN